MAINLATRATGRLRIGIAHIQAVVACRADHNWIRGCDSFAFGSGNDAKPLLILPPHLLRSFLECIDELLVVGGGMQSEREAIAAGEAGKSVVVVTGIGGAADRLAVDDRLNNACRTVRPCTK